MTAYILRRLWQMLPTMLGVIVLVFFLFNWVGGDPAYIGDAAKYCRDHGILVIAEKARHLSRWYIAEDDSAAVARSHIEKQAERIERDISDNRVSGTSLVWKVEIIDEKLVPREYCDPVMTLLRDAVKRGVREIPGTRIFQETRLAIR